MTAVLAVPAAAEPVQDALRARLVSARGNGSLPVLVSFYAQREFRPAWSDGGRARALLALVEAVPGHGLDTADYPLTALRRAVGESGGEPDRQAERDLLYSATLVRLVRQLGSGKVDPRRLYPEWNFAPPPGLAEAVAGLAGLLQAPDLARGVEALAPQRPEYQELRSGLARYRQVEQAGGWSALPAGPKLEPGMKDARVAALRGRLAAEGEVVAAGKGGADLLDPLLAAAVARFQARHGIEPDGVVGRRTLAELNVPVASRIGQIRVNLERLRWVARDREGAHLLVDIAGYTARLYLDGQAAWDSKVVVGRPYRKTPAFRADLQYLVLNPRWVVPPTILREDVLPKVAADPGYLAAHDMQVVDAAGRAVEPGSIAWSDAASGGFPYQMVQKPGPKNPLGQIKFMLPNPYSIYLHDTPSRKLFRRTERAESSGCVRLEKPVELAVLLLDDPQHWSLEALQAELATGRTRTINVKHRVPVLVLYFTATALGQEGVQFRPDLYERDGEVLKALDRPVAAGVAEGL
jgi:L,D-transpeptidase YcbB